jgi:hypothetical protein
VPHSSAMAFSRDRSSGGSMAGAGVGAGTDVHLTRER